MVNSLESVNLIKKTYLKVLNTKAQTQSTLTTSANSPVELPRRHTLRTDGYEIYHPEGELELEDIEEDGIQHPHSPSTITMATTTPLSAISAYRNLLRATRIAFQGDNHMLHAARSETRKHFDQNRSVGVDTPLHIQHAVETADILRHNVVQGRKEEGEGKYELRIHKDIELGDNDTVKIPGGGNVKVDKPCS
ncbi:Mitochondrial zinc maintenance protein 1, mitochondrial [Arachnomyces sp. PD_36]|nr:Mitochondrial zinc maintenance protein 1, mitochondrial [Arachnomyces sp. PD_36]